jgi:steroid delta-isomerase-like uncharacterized protein
MERWFDEVWNKGRESAIDEMAQPDAIAHGLGSEADVLGVDGFKEYFRTFQSALTGIRIEVLETITDGEKVAARVLVRGKHTGESLGIPAKGNDVEFSGMVMVRLKDGKLAEAWNYFDFPKMYKQMA